MFINLYTRTGQFVTEVQIVPPLLVPAEVLTWGTRCFVLQDDGTYREGINVPAQAVTLPTQSYLGGIKHEDPT